MNLNSVDIVNAATLEKVVLSQRVAEFLKDEHSVDELAAVENVARMLAQDVAVQVRESLAFELRTCKSLPHDLAAKIAADIESVSSPFLATTEAFSDTEFAGLIPHLEEHAHITIARRGDLGPNTCHTIVTVGSGKAVSFLIRNEKISLYENSCETTIHRFGQNTVMMDQLSCRADLPVSVVEALAELVSTEYRNLLMKTYALKEEAAEEVSSLSQLAVVNKHVENASPSQIHAYVIDLRKSERLTHALALEMANRGCLSFLESMLALEAGLTLAAVRQALYSPQVGDYVRLMQQGNVNQSYSKKYRKIILSSEQG